MLARRHQDHLSVDFPGVEYGSADLDMDNMWTIFLYMILVSITGAI